MDYKKVYESWLNNEFFDQDTRDELKILKMMRMKLKIDFIKNWHLELQD